MSVSLPLYPPLPLSGASSSVDVDELTSNVRAAIMAESKNVPIGPVLFRGNRPLLPVGNSVTFNPPGVQSSPHPSIAQRHEKALSNTCLELSKARVKIKALEVKIRKMQRQGRKHKVYLHSSCFAPPLPLRLSPSPS